MNNLNFIRKLQNRIIYYFIVDGGIINYDSFELLNNLIDQEIVLISTNKNILL